MCSMVSIAAVPPKGQRSSTMNWFEVDREGLRKILERRGKEWAPGELLQNAWDAPGVSRVEIVMAPVADSRGLVELVVKDDSPEGFAKISDAYTLFGESIKKGDPLLRGRFNVGEKLVLALCKSASICTTKGTIEFSDKGRRHLPRRKTLTGTIFTAHIRMTGPELADVIEAVRTFIGPSSVDTYINGQLLAARSPLKVFTCSLLTDVADEAGVIRRKPRETTVSVYEPLGEAGGKLYELGIPVVSTGDRFDISIGQKVPLTLERDNVPAPFLRRVRALVLNEMVDRLEPNEASNTWIDEALEDKACAREAVGSVVKLRFGEKVVSADPSDLEANHRAVARGYAVVHGGTFSKRQWGQIRESNAMAPAGQLFPTPKPFGAGGSPAQRSLKTPAMCAFEQFVIAIAWALLQRKITVEFLQRFNAIAAYGDGVIYFNVGSLGKRWFEPSLRAAQLDLLLHEFGHEYALNHLSQAYLDALSMLGAKLALLAIERPQMFELEAYQSLPPA